jgi:hypothetical protein
MQAAHLAFISPESEATISAYLPLSPKEFSPSCTPKKTPKIKTKQFLLI